MSNQEQDLPEKISAAETSESKTTAENQPANDQKSDENEKTPSSSSSSSTSSENKPSKESHTPNGPEPTRRAAIPQDIRYATEQGDRVKLVEKYEHYQVSESDSCNIRFLTDHRQKKNLFGQNEADNTSSTSFGRTFNVNMLPAYQTTARHSYKIFGTEANVRKCLIEVVNCMFKQFNRAMAQSDNETHSQQTSTTKVEKLPEVSEVSIENRKLDDKSPPHPTSIFVTTINADSSITEGKKTITPATPSTNEEKSETKEESSEQEQLKFTPIERKPEYTFIILITSQGQEVLKKNWSFFAGSLQQRLNVTVTNPFKLPKFGDNQWQNELSITGRSHENIADAALQLVAFINDVLGVPVQPFKADDDPTTGDYNHHQRTKTTPNNNINNNNDYHQQRRHDHNNGYRQSPSKYQGQSSPLNNNHHERTFVSRGRNGAFEQIILIRSNCVARIVGTRGSNLRRLQSKCHLRDIVVARHPNENGYVECTLSAYQTRNLNFAIDTIRGSLRNEDEQAVQVFDSHYVDVPSQSSPFQNSPQNDHPQLSVPNQNVEHYHSHGLGNNRYQHHQQPLSLAASADLHRTHGEPGFMTRPLHLANGNPVPQPSYNFQNTPSFDFTHRPTSASRKTDKRPGEVNDCNNSTNNGPARTPNDCQYQRCTGSSSSNSSSVSPRHKSKRTCPETKEIDCTTDDGFWIQKQFYHALDDTSKELFDSLLDKLEKIRIVTEENVARKQQRLVGRNRSNKSRGFTSAVSVITHATVEQDSTGNSTQENDEQITKSEEEETTTRHPNEQESSGVVIDQK